MINPYEYMLSLRENKILFPYLEQCFVHFTDQEGWTIVGESIFGRCKIYMLSNDLIRIVLPIDLPKNYPVHNLAFLLLGIQSYSEGLITLEDNEGNLLKPNMYLGYNLHCVVASKEEDTLLDKALITFAVEKKQIQQSFELMASKMEKVGADPIENNDNLDSNEELELNGNMDSLWEVMKEIDSLIDEDEDEDEDE
jgi:hypothetical protein